MKKLLAISGGVDSVCLLHMMKDDPEVLVAHFNHGTRPSAKTDQEFVKQLAEKYQKPFFTAEKHLGEHASEETARAARYDFLRTTAREQNAKIYTAHHLDDLIESIAINLSRGTGWRGLVPLGAEDIERPFIAQKLTKADLLRYAAEHRLTFREDPTNHEDYYLRNRLREQLKTLSKTQKSALIELYEQQKLTKTAIDQILRTLAPEDRTYQRAWFKNDETSLEFLSFAAKSAKIPLTRPQLENFLTAILTYAPEKSFNLPKNRLVVLHKAHFVLK